MTEVIKPKQTFRVLEIGTGSGYQAAVLSEIVKEVYTIEIIETLGKEASARWANSIIKTYKQKQLMVIMAGKKKHHLMLSWLLPLLNIFHLL